MVDHEERMEILAIGREMVKRNLVIGSTGNISRRTAEPDGCLITPSGIPYADLEPDDLVRVDAEGEVLAGSLKPSTESRLHLAIYRARPEVQGIIHAHSPYASVFAVNRADIPPVLDEMAQLLGGGIRVAAYAPSGSLELAENAVEGLGDAMAVLLASHGLVAVGKSLKEAWLVCQLVEKCAMVYLLARLAGNPYVLSNDEVASLRQVYLSKYGQ